MLNGLPLNSVPLNGSSVVNLANSDQVDGSVVLCPGRSRNGVRHRGASIIIVLENRYPDSSWVMERMETISRIVGRRRD